MKPYSFLIIIAIIFCSCDKNDREYLSDNGCFFEIEGIVASQSTDDTFEFPLYTVYSESSINPWYWDGYTYKIMITRYSEDFQNNISFDLYLSEEYEILSGRMSGILNLFQETNTIHNYEIGAQYLHEHISDINFDTTSLALTFTFSNTVSNFLNEEVSYSGLVDVQLYKMTYSGKH